MVEILQHIKAENDINKGNNINDITSQEGTTQNTTVGLWTPMNTSFTLQHLRRAEQEKAMEILLKKGYEEYYYVMNNFEDPKFIKNTDDLLDTANKTNLKIIIILLPPSEGALVPVTIGMVRLNILILLKGNIQDHLRVLRLMISTG